MDFKILGIIIATVAGLYAIARYGIPYVKGLILQYNIKLDFKDLLKTLKRIALAIGDDEQDEITEDIYEVLLETYVFACELDFSTPENRDESSMAIINYAVVTLRDEGVNIGEREEGLIKSACELILMFVN